MHFCPAPQSCVNVLHGIVPTSGVSQLATSITHASAPVDDDDELAPSSDDELSLLLLSLELDDVPSPSLSLPLDEDPDDELASVEELDDPDDELDELASGDDSSSAVHAPTHETTTTAQRRIDQPIRASVTATASWFGPPIRAPVSSAESSAQPGRRIRTAHNKSNRRVPVNLPAVDR